MVVKVPEMPRVAGALMKPIQKVGCLSPDQHDYSIFELVDGNQCLQDHVIKVEGQLDALQKAVKRREKILGDLQKNKPTK